MIRPHLCQADDNTDTLESLLVIRTSNGNTEWKYVLQHSLKSTHPPELKRKGCVFLYHGKWSWLLLCIVLGEHASACRWSGARNHVVSPWSQFWHSHISSLGKTASKKYGQGPSFPLWNSSNVFYFILQQSHLPKKQGYITVRCINPGNKEEKNCHTMSF